MANPTCILIYLSSRYSPLFFSWQSKHKEDTSTTHPILLDELKLEVYPFVLHAFPLPCVTMCSISPPFICVCVCVPCVLLFCYFCFQANPKPISFYHPTTKEVSTAMGTPMEGFFDGANIVAEAIASTSAAA